MYTETVREEIMEGKEDKYILIYIHLFSLFIQSVMLERNRKTSSGQIIQAQKHKNSRDIKKQQDLMTVLYLSNKRFRKDKMKL